MTNANWPFPAFAELPTEPVFLISNDTVLQSIVPYTCSILISTLGFSPGLRIWLSQEELPLLMRKGLLGFVGFGFGVIITKRMDVETRVWPTRHFRRLLPRWVLFPHQRRVISATAGAFGLR